jgi:molybdopterin-guanine dinucleotide biosynthesis protein B
MNVAALTGSSGAGKTTLLVQLIERFVAEGKTVGAIKHTHHPLNDENRGDTALFLAAGAEPVILARSTEGVIFRRDGISRVAYHTPDELLTHLDNDVVLVEGYRKYGPWPQIEITAKARPTVEELATELDRIWRP